MFEAKEMDKRIIDILYVRATNNINTTGIELNQIISAAANNHIVIFKSYVQEPIGYLIFAKVNSCTLNMINANAGEIIYPYEWKCGKIIFVVDSVLSKQQITFARQQLITYLRSLKVAAFWRRDRLNIIYRGKLFRKKPAQNIKLAIV